MTVVLPATLDEITEAVMLYFRIDRHELLTGKRQSRYYARGVMFYVMNRMSRLSNNEIAEHFGMTGTGVWHGVTRTEARMADPILRADVAAVMRIVSGEDVQAVGSGHVASDRERSVA